MDTFGKAPFSHIVRSLTCPCVSMMMFDVDGIQNEKPKRNAHASTPSSWLRTMNASRSKGFKYIEQLTWLRGFAAFLVIVSHSLRATEVKYSPDDEAASSLLMSLFDLGSFGVVLFFVLSGCTLYISNASKVGGHRNIMAFYLKRFFRIWPAYIVALAAYMLFREYFSNHYITPLGHWVEQQFLASYSAADALSYAMLTFNLTGPEGLFNNAFWSLPVEFQYYLIFPLLVLSLRSGIIGPLAIGALLYLVPRTGLIDIDDDTVFLLAFSFCGGVAVGYLYTNFDVSIRGRTGFALLSILLLFISLITNGFIPLPDIPLLAERWNWYGGIAIISVYLVLITRFDLHNRMEAFLSHYGNISYSTYLYHNIFVGLSVLFMVNMGIHDGSLKLFLTFSFTLLATYVVASLSYRYIERPFIGIGRSMVKRISE